jgi:PAS domain S-box-containing protein
MRLKKYLLAISLAIPILFLLALSAIYDDAREQAILQLNIGQSIQAQQASKGIEEYIGGIIRTLTFLSRNPDVVVMNNKGKQLLGDYQQISPADIRGVTRVSAQGKIIFTLPYTSSIGRDISQQDHIRLIQRTHRVVVSDVFLAVQGFRTVAVHVPVFKGGVYDGTLAFLLSFDTIAEKYIDAIHVGTSGYAWLLSEKGIVISSPIVDNIGKNIFVASEGFPEVLAMANEMLQRKQGTATYHYNRIGEQRVQEVLKQAVYRPIILENTFWSIVVATPEDEAMASLAGLRTRLMIISVALFAFTILCMYFIFRAQSAVEEKRKRDAVNAVLVESELRYRGLFRQNPAPMLIYDRSTLTLLTVNEAFLRHYGYSDAQVASMRLVDLYPDDQKEAITSLIKKLHGYQNVGEWRHRKADGTFFNITACSNDLVYDGHVARVAVITDVTDRIVAEEKTRALNTELEKRVAERTAELRIARDRAESADQLKSAFLATMSHELRTPLNSIIGFTGILLQGLAGKLNDEQAKQMGMVQNSAQHLLALINDVLDISKIEAGQLEVFRARYNFRKALERVIASVQPLADRKGLMLHASIAPDVGEIVSDARRVDQIVLNILNNAIKFTEKGSVRVECRLMHNRLSISVTDTGIGIGPEDRERIFKPFAQVDTGTARTHEGTGLGLSICDRLVEKLGGTIRVESTPGIGSTFTIELPIDEGQ